jgi:predicted secreted Zn-dependent protease
MDQKMRPARIALALLAAAAFQASPAVAASVSKSYSYFTVTGSTLAELETELARRGPQVRSTGERHPGATRLEFKTSINYLRDDRGCRVGDATVMVEARIILPRWKSRSRPEREARIVWNTLAADIKRHEERHVEIARNSARELELELGALDRERDCARLSAKAKRTSDEVMRRHDEAQTRFDRVEGINFESRMLRLLRYRIERIESGAIAE